MRITYSLVYAAVHKLNVELGRPVEMFANKIGEPTKFNIRHIALDSNSYGHQLQEIISTSGGERPLTDRMSVRDMYHYVNGMSLGKDISNR